MAGLGVAPVLRQPEEEYSSATTSAAVYDASAIGRLKVTGADGLDLLHRLSTNAVESLIPGQGPTQSSPTTVDASSTSSP